MKPDAVLRTERVLGVEAESWTPVVSGGWSRNEHWTIVCKDGTRAFLKLASIEPSPQWLRDEVRVYECVEGPFMPRFLGWEDGEQPLLVLEDASVGARRDALTVARGMGADFGNDSWRRAPCPLSLESRVARCSMY